MMRCCRRSGALDGDWRVERGAGTGTGKLGTIKSLAQTHHISKAGKEAFEILHYVKNLPFDRITRHGTLGPAFREQCPNHRFMHERVAAYGLAFERQQISAMQRKMSRLGYHSTRQNGLELGPRLEPPHA